jgi:hypothetical protein
MSEGGSIQSWRAGSDGEIVELAKTWLDSDALGELMTALGGPPAGSPPAALQAWTAANLDTRGGAERRDAPSINWRSAWSEALVRAAAPLGLITTAPPSQSFYDAALVLGGATTGNRLRVALTHQLISSGCRFGEIVGLTTDRELGAREPDGAADHTEARNLLRYLEAAFGPLRAVAAEAGSDHGETTASWRDEHFTGSDGVNLRLVVAPGSPGTRATTADAIDFYLGRSAVQSRESTLVVTSAIYAPYQFFATAPRLLADAATTAELVGTPTAQDDVATLAQRVGQEIHAAVDAASRLITCG